MGVIRDFLKDNSGGLISGTVSLIQSERALKEQKKQNEEANKIALRGIESAEDLNRENLQFQANENQIERLRADSTLQRTSRDAHLSGQSAFDAQAIPLGDVSTPQNDIGSISGAYTNQANVVQNGSSVLSNLSMANVENHLKIAQMLHSNRIDKRTADREDAKLSLAEKNAMFDNNLKDIQAKKSENDIKLANNKDLREEERQALELKNMIADTALKNAQELKTLTDNAIAQSGEEREKTMHEIEKKQEELKYQMLLQDFNLNADTYPIVRDLMKNDKKVSDEKLKYLAQMLELEIDEQTLSVLRGAFGSTSDTHKDSLTGSSRTSTKQNKTGNLKKKYGGALWFLY